VNRAYRLGGLKIASDLDLPELMTWDGSADAPADLVFRLGNVPQRLEQPDHVDILFQTRGRSQYLLALPGIGRILVEDGIAVTVEPEPGTDPTDTRPFLNNPVQAALWHQRGLLPLHATVVAADGRAVALAGPSGAGKSTLAAVLAVRGCSVLADDVCVVEVSAGGEASVLPAIPRLRLWRDALECLGLSAEGLKRVSSGLEKFLVNIDSGTPCEPHRLAAVVVLNRQLNSAVTITRLRGARATGALNDVVYIRRAAKALGRDPEIFCALTQLAPAGVTVWQLNVPEDLTCLGAAAAKVLTVLEE